MELVTDKSARMRMGISRSGASEPMSSFPKLDNATVRSKRRHMIRHIEKPIALPGVQDIAHVVGLENQLARSTRWISRVYREETPNICAEEQPKQKNGEKPAHKESSMKCLSRRVLARRLETDNLARKNCEISISTVFRYFANLRARFILQRPNRDNAV